MNFQLYLTKDASLVVDLLLPCTCIHVLLLLKITDKVAAQLAEPESKGKGSKKATAPAGKDATPEKDGTK